GRDLHRRVHREHRGRDADGVGAQLLRLPQQRGDVGGGGLGLEQGVVDEGGELSAVERGHDQILADAPVPAHPFGPRSGHVGRHSTDAHLSTCVIGSGAIGAARHAGRAMPNHSSRPRGDPSMSTSAPPENPAAGSPLVTTLGADVDPYVIDGSQISEPPRRLRGKLRFLGPGMITSAAVVGSGELLTATALGAEVGFMLLWLVLVSTFLKVWVQIELARWSVSTGRVALDGYKDVPPRIGGRGWISWLVLLMFLQFFIGQAGVISASAFAFSTLFPIGPDPYSLLSIGVWVAILVVIAIGIHAVNRYAIVENISTVLVLLVTAFAIAMVFLLGGTEFAWNLADLGDGMRFQIAAGAFGVALAMFGMTGVGAGETTAYTYWVVEKGYAAWTGPNDGSESWVRRARGWISVMKVDAWVSWIIYTVSTAAFYVLGA